MTCFHAFTVNLPLRLNPPNATDQTQLQGDTFKLVGVASSAGQAIRRGQLVPLMAQV